MNMTTTPAILDLPERDKQPVIRVEALLYPSELQVTKDKLFDMLSSIDATKPENTEVFEGLSMLHAGIKRAIKAMETSSSKAGA